MNIDRDPHTNFVLGQPQITHFDWSAKVDFTKHILKCQAIIEFSEGGRTNLDLRNLNIIHVIGNEGEEVEYSISDMPPVLAQCLTVTVPAGHRKIRIFYTTSPDASALQWLSPEQTLGKVHPFLFSQGQALHTPSYLPCQDTPSIRFTYTARIVVPTALRALMAAGHVSREEVGEDAVECWEMNQPVPSYLFALAVGELEGIDITDRCRVYAEPALVQAAADEFADVGKMMEAAEQLAGPYEWERFDILVLPPSFPYGGMENPRLVFVTPTLITGDKSMVSVIGHELAHFWTGNLITNSNWRHFWLNEGWTTYLEWRICEALYGRDRMLLQAVLLQAEWERDFQRFVGEGRPELTALASYLPSTLNPDDVFSRVPYFKGAMFIMALEQAVGRRFFDRFILKYIKKFRFTSIDTATFLDFVAKELGGVLEKVKAWRWVYEGGLPDDAPELTSPLIEKVKHLAQQFLMPPRPVGQWDGAMWTLYLGALPRPVPVPLVQDLNREFSLSSTLNFDVRWAFLLLALESGYVDVKAEVEMTLGQVGRTKYVQSLFKAMADLPNGIAWAHRTLEAVKSGYHPITASQVQRVIYEAEKVSVS